MFDIEKARRNGIDEKSISILEEINKNNEKEKNCNKHDFERIKIKGVPKYRCKNCGCEESVSWVCGYNRGIQHAQKR